MRILVDIESGKLSEISFPRILHALFRDHATGRLTLRRMQITKTLLFNEGMPVYVESDQAAERLDTFLLQHQVIDTEEQQEALRRSIDTEKPIGEVLVAMEIIEPFELYKYLRQVFARAILDVYRWDDGEFTFEAGELDENQFMLKMNPAQLNLTGIEKFTPPEKVMEEFRPPPDATFILNPIPPYDVERLKLGPEETRLLTLLKEPYSITGLDQEISNKEFDWIRRKLLALTTLEMAQLGTAAKKRAETRSAAAAPPPPAAGKGVDLKEAERRVGTYYLDYKDKDYFAFLGLERKADEATVRRAFSEAFYFLNPYTYRELEEEAKGFLPALEELWPHALRAWDAIGDKLKRTTYLEKIDAPQRLADGTPISEGTPLPEKKDKPKAEKKPGAAFAIKTDLLKGDQHFKKGLKFMEDKRYVKAQESFQFAMDVEPNSLHRAYLTWAEFMQNPMRRFEDAVETLEVLIKKEPDRDVLHYIFAQVYRQMGDFDSALRELKHTKRCNPSHVSADQEMREVRAEADEKTKKKKKRRFFG